MSEPPRTLRQKVHELVDVPPEGGRKLDWFDLSIGVLIVLNVVAFMLESVDAINARYGRLLRQFELFSVAVFTIEYLMRLWSCTAMPRYRHPIAGRLAYAVRPIIIIDLLAILPTYLPLLGIDLRFLRVVRLMRISRVLKLGRYSEASGLLIDVLRRRSAELGAMVSVLIILLVLASSLMYIAEHDAQAQDGKFASIPDSMWWAVITLTTIGYGDVYPVTIMGKILGGLIAVSGIGIVALPTAIIATGFADELKARREARARSAAPNTCPHCGKPLPEPAQSA
jgi:voltage-gated potassium channel